MPVQGCTLPYLYSMMCQSSVVEVVGTFKICKIATLVKIRLRSQPVTSAAVHDADIIVHVYFLLG